MSRPRLTRRGEAVVLLGVAIALGLLLMTLRYRWVQAYAIAGAAVLGIMVVALMVATVLIRVADLVAGGIRKVRLRWHARQLAAEFAKMRAAVEAAARDVGTPLVEPVRNIAHLFDEIPPEALQRIQTAVEEEDSRRRPSRPVGIEDVEQTTLERWGRDVDDELARRRRRRAL